MTAKKAEVEIAKQVLDTPFQDAVKENFLKYSLAVIQGRALPSAVDGLKPVQRRILWAMHQGKYTFSGPFVKSARVVGDVIGKYHPHADGAVYSTLVNMTQHYMRESVIASQGNFGIRGEDDAAAMRYTECKLHQNAEKMYMQDITNSSVDYTENYDQSLKEPVQLPTRAPMLLVNGSFGIAVSVSTSIPSHSLSEVIDMSIAVINNDTEKAVSAFKGPDFVSGGKVFASQETLRQIFFSGKGKVNVYGVLDKIQGTSKTPNQLRILEIPWTTSKPRLIKQLLDLEKEIPDIEVRSSAKPNEPKITIVTKEDLERVEKLVYKKTSFQSTYSYNCVYLDGRLPIRDGLYTIIKKWHAFRVQTLQRKFTESRSAAALDLDFYHIRKKLIENGILKFITILTEESIEKAEKYLQELGATDDTIARIMSQKISTLSKADTLQAEKRITELTSTIAELTDLIENSSSLNKYIVKELLEIKKTASPRRTELLTEDIQDFNFVSTKLETRSVQIKGTKLILDSGDRISLTESFIAVHANSVSRIRIKDLRKYKTNATVDVNAMFQEPVQGVFQSGEVLVVYKNGRVLKLNIDRLKIWNSKDLENGEMIAILPITETSKGLILKTKDGKIIANGISALPDAESRAIIKLRLSSAEVSEAWICTKFSQVIDEKMYQFQEAFKMALHSSAVKPAPTENACEEVSNLNTDAHDINDVD